MAETDNGALIAATTDLELAGASSIPIYRALAGSSKPVSPEGSTDVLVPGAETGLAGLGGACGSLGPKLRIALGQVLDTVADHRNQATIRETAQDLISESFQRELHPAPGVFAAT